MISHSLKVIFRSLYRETSYSFINIVGLAVGIACCMLLGLYIQSEVTYDRHFDKHERIFRIVSELDAAGNVNLFAPTSYALGPLLSEEDPGIEAFVRFYKPSSGFSLFRYEDKAFSWDKVLLADASVFDIFDHEIIYGDPKDALADPKTIAISRSFSEYYFGQENPVGKVLEGDLNNYRVAVVFEDLPDNTHLKYDALATYQELSPRLANPTMSERTRHDLWYWRMDYTYVLLSPNYDLDGFAGVTQAFFDKYMASYEDAYHSSVRYFLEPLTSIHLGSKAQRDEPRGSRFYVWAFAGIAAFILGVACINYMNLSTARFSKRAREVAIRKTLGADRLQLSIQFLIEALFFTVTALLLSLAVVHFMLNYTSLNSLFGKALTMAPLAEPGALVLIIIGTLSVGLFAGAYPALHLSNADPSSSLQAKKSWTRHGLVFVQFLVSICVIACTLIMYAQMRYVQQKPLGFDKEHKLVMKVSGGDNIEKLPTFITQLKTNSRVLEASSTRGRVGGSIDFAQADVETEEGTYATQSYNWFFVDENYVDAMGIKVVDGRNFDPANRDDVGKSVLVNETLARKMGWQDPIGKGIRYEQDRPPVTVVGVMRDFHFHGLQQAVEPMVLWLAPPDNFEGWSVRARAAQSRVFTVSLAGDRVYDTLSFIRGEWERFFPDRPFEYTFLDDSLDELYASDFNLMKLASLFAGLCILISCLGLFGLTAFTIARRTKEIGVRKVLGATTQQIALLLFQNIFVVVLGAAVLASAIAYWIMMQWLDGFYYHQAINPIVFLVAAGTAILVSFFTTASQAFATSQTDPVRALRYE